MGRRRPVAGAASRRRVSRSRPADRTRHARSPRRVPDRRCPSRGRAKRGAVRTLLLAGRPAIGVDRSARPSRSLGAVGARVGRRCGRGRSTTRTTASPSIGTCSRRSPTRPRWSRPRRAARSARARRAAARPREDRRPATTPRSASSSRARSAPASVARSGRDRRAAPGSSRHHLLLSEVASRRDLDDDATDRPRGARRSESVESLHLLAALTEADAKATGPTAWSPWKAELVGRTGRPGRRAPPR